MFKKKLYVLVLLLLIYACQQEKTYKTKSNVNCILLEKQDLKHLQFTNTIKETVENNVLTYDYFYNGGGVCVADFNNDNFPEIFLTGNQTPNKLLINQKDLTFNELNNNSLSETNYWSTGATVVDINNDGLLDIYVCNSGPDLTSGKRRNQFFINKGNFEFEDQAADYNLDIDYGSTMASFFDYDKDGDLDMFLLNHSQFQKLSVTDFEVKINELQISTNNKTEPSYKSQCSHLYENNNGKFTEVTKQTGILLPSFGLGVITKDFNNDGWTDIYVANDYHLPDRLFINQKNGTFKDEIKMRTRHTPFFSMGCDFEDINNDGNSDILNLDMAPVGHYRSKTLMPSMSTALFDFVTKEKQYHHQYMFNSLQLNNGNGTYRDIGLYSGIGKSEWSWSALINDFDLDGLADIFITNGFKRDTKNNDWRVEAEKIEINSGGNKELLFEHLQKAPSEKTMNYLLKNKGNLKFEQTNNEWGITEKTFSNGAIYADLDLDGDDELIINNIDDEFAIYKNNAVEKRENNFLTIKLLADKLPMLNKTLNVKIKLHSKQQVWFKELHSVKGFQSSVLQNSVNFGLGNTKKLDSIYIIWNENGDEKLTSKYYNIDANKVLNVSYETAEKIIETQVNHPLFHNVRNIQPNLNYLHKEDNFNDYKTEILLPYRMSQLGPQISVGDVNNDKQVDFFIGGAKGQNGELFVQNQGVFYNTQGLPWQQASNDFEDMGSILFDADNDGDNDLYIVSGGNSKHINDPNFQDRLYLNNGDTFTDATAFNLPKITSSGSVVKGCDFDKDGDIDLFIGGRHLPSLYPKSPESILLVNEQGKFANKTNEIAGNELVKAGMVTDAIWSDYDNDGDDDLLIVGEWGGIKTFKNVDGELQLTETNLTKLKGFWQSINAKDLDNDGDIDYVVGNIGENSKFKVSFEKPLHINATDFDDNGTNDIVLSTYEKNERVPVRGRECTAQQMPFIADKFNTYNNYAKASFNDIYSEKKLSKSTELMVNTLSSYVIENLGNGTFKEHLLPAMAQLSPINTTNFIDFNNDGLQDLLIAGNLYETEVETPRYDAGIGQIFINKGSFNFTALPTNKTGLYLPMDVKDIKVIPSINGNFYIIVANNNNYLQCYINNF